MPIRYFKCHTLPYPSYNLAATPGTTDRLVLTWNNGPPGQATPTMTEVCIAFLFDTAAETCITVAGNVEAYTATLGGGGGLQARVRIRRQNSAGYGDYTPYVTGTVGT